MKSNFENPEQMDLPFESVDSPEQLSQVEHYDGEPVLGPIHKVKIGVWAATGDGRLVKSYDSFPLTAEQQEELKKTSNIGGQRLMEEWAEEYILQNKK